MCFIISDVFFFQNVLKTDQFFVLISGVLKEKQVTPTRKSPGK